MSRKGMSSGNRENLDAIRKELTAAIALEPNYPDAYSLLGMTLSFAEKSRSDRCPAKSHCFESRQSMDMGNLASGLPSGAGFDHAIPLLQELQTSTEPGIASMLRQQLQQVEAYKSAVSGRSPQSGRMEPAVQTIELNDFLVNQKFHGVSTQNAPEKRRVSDRTNRYCS